jgi:hypothetical protein
MINGPGKYTVNAAASGVTILAGLWQRGDGR